jgi:hypothetical protein
MKLCAILNVWEDTAEFIEPFIANTMKYCNGIIIIASTKSNYGEVSEDYIPEIDSIIKLYANIRIEFYSPALYYALHCETDKRNYGLNIARQEGYTHFITCDTDEFYDPEEVNQAKKEFHEKPSLAGLVCRTKVYVKSPTLTIGYDTTLVPFIHKITPGLKHEFNRLYPFAWKGKDIRIDPSRSLNINSRVDMCDVTMHHYSHVRKDYAKKIRNSTARANLQRHKNLVQNFLHLKEGDIFELYPNRPLVREQARFNIPDYGVVQDFQLSERPTDTGDNP